MSRTRKRLDETFVGSILSVANRNLIFPLFWQIKCLPFRNKVFIKSFNRTVPNEFFRETFQKKFYASLNERQEDLDNWLDYYNNECPHRASLNMGRRPIETIEEGKLIKEQRPKEAA